MSFFIVELIAKYGMHSSPELSAEVNDGENLKNDGKKN
jgi:hypothetical protein